MKGLTCFCCGTEITAPQFYKGKSYGWTCIKKVSDQKRVKSNDVYLLAETTRTVVGRWVDLTATLNGIEYKTSVPKDCESVACIQDGLLCVVSDNKPLFKSVRLGKDENGYTGEVLDKNGIVLYSK